MSNQLSVQELHKPVIRKFGKHKVCCPINDYIWAANLVDMQLMSKFNKEFWFLLCAFDIYGNYAWVTLSKRKMVLQLLILFKTFWMSPDTNQIEYGWIKVVKFIMDQ